MYVFSIEATFFHIPSINDDLGRRFELDPILKFNSFWFRSTLCGMEWYPFLPICRYTESIPNACMLWCSWNKTVGFVIIVVADILSPNWHQTINNNHADFTVMSHGLQYTYHTKLRPCNSIYIYLAGVRHSCTLTPVTVKAKVLSGWMSWVVPVAPASCQLARTMTGVHTAVIMAESWRWNASQVGWCVLAVVMCYHQPYT